MYSASQKLLSLLGEEVSQDLLYASSHLSILSFCGFNNPVAQNLFNQLQIFFNDIREIVVSKAYLQLRELHSNSGVMAVAPLLLYGAAEQWEGIVEFVLEVTKRILEVLENRLSTQRPMPREADMRS